MEGGGKDRVRKDWSGPNYAHICTIGEQLRQRLHTCIPPVIQNRRYHFRVYKNSFIAQELVDWLVKRKEAPDRQSAVKLLRILQEFHVIHHVCDDHLFKDEYLFYRFRKDDNSFPKTRVTSVYLKAEKLHMKLFRGGLRHAVVKDLEEDGEIYRNCFSGKDVVDILVKDKEVKSMKQAVAMCRELIEHGLLRHVKSEEDFEVDSKLMYQFADLSHLKLVNLFDLMEHRKRTSSTDSRGSTSSTPPTPINSGYPWDFNQSVGGQLTVPNNLHSRRHSSPVTLPHNDSVVSMASLEEYFHDRLPTNFESEAEVPQESRQRTSSSGDSTYDSPCTSPSGIIEGLNSKLEKLLSPGSTYTKKDIRILSDAVGFGFVVRGNCPSHVQTIDPNSPAAAAGLKVGQYIVAVNDINVLHMDHPQVARVILSIPSVVNLTVLERETK
ncbi:DEP domain-containing mTOR-interacting protein-like [Glandiceps talaboti]